MCELTEDVYMSYGSDQSILNEDLGRKWVSAKFVTKRYSVEQKEKQLSAVQNLFNCVEEDKLFENGHKVWQIMGLWLWPQNQYSVFTVEDPNLSETEESMN